MTTPTQTHKCSCAHTKQQQIKFVKNKHPAPDLKVIYREVVPPVDIPACCVLIAVLLLHPTRSIGAIISWIRFIFTTEQKKTDFKPEEDAPMQMISPVSLICLSSSGVALMLTDLCHCMLSIKGDPEQRVIMNSIVRNG